MSDPALTPIAASSPAWAPARHEREERAERDEDLVAMAGELEAVRRDSARSKAELSQRVSAAAHDLKSPLHVIVGFSQLFAARYGDRLDDDGRALLESITRGANQMTELIDDLLVNGRTGTAKPVATAVDQPPRPGVRGDSTASGTSPGPGPLQVLLVEDSDEHTKLMSALLSQADGPAYRLHPVDNVQAALLALGHIDIDCVLLDLSLPDANDLEALAQVRSAAPLVPVVVTTSSSDDALAFAAVREGAQDFLVKGQIDSARLSRSIRWAVQRKALENDLARDALHDPLTQLPNRTLLLDRLRLALVRAERSGDRVAAFYLDLDNFKPVNDQLGHDAGDQVLIEIAGHLRTAIRPQDTVARIGGDEFVVMCEGFDDPDLEVGGLRARLADAVATPIAIGDDVVVLSVSIGVSVSGPSAEADDILRAADQAMYQAKRSRLQRQPGLTVPSG